MKLGHLAVTFILLLLILPTEVESGWGFVAKVAKVAAKALVCHKVCKSRVCNSKGACYPVCNTVCNYIGKRELPSQDQKREKEDQTYSIAYPSSLKEYDQNKDGRISSSEFYSAINRGHKSRITQQIFRLADKNGDGFIGCQEFKAAPLVFSKEPSC